METTQNLQYGRGNRLRGDENTLLKITALQYLKEALIGENYEECPELITAALGFGARENEIRNLLEDPRRTPGA